MAKNRRVSDIDIDEDVAYLEREWRLQPFAWALIGLLILAALLGVFGKGVAADAQAADPTGVLTVEYARFERFRSPTTIALTVGPGMATGGKITLFLEREFVDGIDIDSIEPEPDSVQTDAQRMVYEFEVTNPSEPAHVYINYEYETMGAVRPRIGLANGPQLDVGVFVYP